MKNSLRHFFFLIAISSLLVACKRSAEFPPLKNGEGLRADCSILMSSFPEGTIASNVWPKSVKELKPTRVIREKNGVRIFVRDEPGYRGGYCVFLDPQFAPSTKNTWIQKTEFKGIYEFRTY